MSIDDRLAELEASRKKLEEAIKQSQEMLRSVDDKITDFKRRQEARLTVDERVDNSVVDALSEREKKAAAGRKGDRAQTDAVNRQLQTTQGETRLLPRDLTAEEVHVAHILPASAESDGDEADGTKREVKKTK
jgi:hypothetical protein